MESSSLYFSFIRGLMWDPTANMFLSFVDSCLICGLMWNPAANIFLSFVDSCGPVWTQCGLVVDSVP